MCLCVLRDEDLCKQKKLTSFRSKTDPVERCWKAFVCFDSIFFFIFLSPCSVSCSECKVITILKIVELNKEREKANDL